MKFAAKRLVELHLLIGRLGVLALALLHGLGGVTAIEDGATVLVELELSDHNVGWVNADVHSGT